MKEHRQWYSRGYLPHCDQPGKIQSVTIRLCDSMPESRRNEWEKLLERGGTRERHERIEAYLDAGYGSCWLGRPEVAEMVEGALCYGDGTRYRLLAWVVMPNHLHFVFEMRDGWPLGEVMQHFKSFTSHEANRLLRRKGRFWFPDYRDRYVRGLRHLRTVIRYLHENPVKAGLVDAAADWSWSSARFAPRETTRLADHNGMF